MKPNEEKEKPKKPQEAQKAETQQKIEELTETLQRLQAEFENYKKRVEKEVVQHKLYAAKDLVSELLPVLDSFELAFQNTKDKEKFIIGMKLVYGQLHTILENAGLRKIEAVDKQFDPHYHEVLMQQPSETDDGRILEEFQKGYMLKDAVLRHSKVKVAKMHEQKTTQEAKERPVEGQE